MKHNSSPSAQLELQLHSYFPVEARPHIQELTGFPKRAPIVGLNNEFVPYVRANKGASKPLLYVPGFGEGITNKLPMAVAAASMGFDVILPGQNRSGLVSSKNGKNSAIQTQARNILAVIDHAKLHDGFNIAAHSLGGPVADEVVRLAVENDIDMSDSTVALLVSAGVAKEKSYLDIGMRWAKMMKSEYGPDNKDFPDRTGETGIASARNLAANLRQTFGEVRALRHEQIDMARLCQSVGQVVLVCYADDEMYPQASYYKWLKEYLSVSGVDNFVALTPVTYGNPDLGETLGRKPGAVHDDEQLNPYRVMNALAPFYAKQLS